MTITVEILPIEDAQDDKCIVAWIPEFGWWAIRYNANKPKSAVTPTHYIKGLPETLEGME